MEKIKYIILSIVLVIGTFIIIIVASNKNEVNNISQLNVMNWSSYIPKEVINDFEDKYNIKVNYLTYSSNEELLAKLTSSNEGTYDLIFPSDYMVELMIKRGMLEKMDKSKVDMNNIDDIFLNQSFDKKNDYSLPFLAATTVIAYNTENIKEDIVSYNQLLDKKYKNDIVLLDDQRIVIGMGLLATGSDMNEVNKEALDNSEVWLKRLRDNVKAYDSDSPKTLLITGEVNIGVIWNAEAEIARNNNPNIKIIYPYEGHAISLDNYAIVKGSKNQENAYKFINYLLNYEISKKITDEYPYISPIVNSNYSKEQLYEALENSTFVKNIDSYIEDYDKIWADIK